MRWIFALLLLLAVTSVPGAQRLLLRQDTQDTLRNKINDNFSEVYQGVDGAVRLSDTRGMTNSGTAKLGGLTMDGELDMADHNIRSVFRVGSGSGWLDFEEHSTSSGIGGGEPYDTSLWTGFNANYLEGRNLAWMTDLRNMSNAPPEWTNEVGLVRDAMTHVTNTFLQLSGGTMPGPLTNETVVVVGSNDPDAGTLIHGSYIRNREYGGEGINFEQEQLQLSRVSPIFNLASNNLSLSDSSLFTGLNAEFVGGVHVTGLVTKAGTSVVSGVIVMGEEPAATGASMPMRFDQYSLGSNERWTNFFFFYRGKPYIGTTFGLDLNGEVLTRAGASGFAVNGQSMTGTWFAVGNTATNWSWVGGGSGNIAGGNRSAVGGGWNNQAHGQYSAISGGRENKALALESTVGGGAVNVASGMVSTVAGGYRNFAGGYGSTVGGGDRNSATGTYATVPGGFDNVASGWGSFAAGNGAQATHSNSFVWAGSVFNSLGPGTFNVWAPNTTLFKTRTFAIQADSGSSWLAQFSEEGSQIWGPLTIEGYVTTATGAAITSRVHTLETAGYLVQNGDITGRWFAAGNTNIGPNGFIGGGSGNYAESPFATIGGGYQNSATGFSATVGGGYLNSAGFHYATVGGGYQNSAATYYTTVGGGYQNTSAYNYATVGGGFQNMADGDSATVGGGRQNSAVGNYATIPGGFNNYAAASSFAVGVGARATNSGSAVFSLPGTTNTTFGSRAANSFNVRSVGGAYFLSSGLWMQDTNGASFAVFTSTNTVLPAPMAPVSIASGAATNTVRPSGFHFEHPTFGSVGYELSFGRGLWRYTNNAGGVSTWIGPVWDQGNDGSGSGLDADLLDGLDSSAFAPVSVSQPNLGGGSPGTKFAAYAIRTNSFGAGQFLYDNGASFASAALSIPQSAGSDFGFMFSPVGAAARWERNIPTNLVTNAIARLGLGAGGIPNSFSMTYSTTQPGLVLGPGTKILWWDQSDRDIRNWAVTGLQAGDTISIMTPGLNATWSTYLLNNSAAWVLQSGPDVAFLVPSQAGSPSYFILTTAGSVTVPRPNAIPFNYISRFGPAELNMIWGGLDSLASRLNNFLAYDILAYNTPITVASNDLPYLTMPPVGVAALNSLGYIARPLSFVARSPAGASVTGSYTAAWSSGQAIPVFMSGNTQVQLARSTDLSSYQTVAGFNSWTPGALKWVGTAPTSRTVPAGSRGQIRHDTSGDNMTNVYYHNGSVWGLAFTVNTNALPP